MNSQDNQRDRPYERPLPNSPEAEATFIGITIQNGDIAPQAIDLLKPSDIYNPTYRKIYEAIVSIFSQWLEVTPINIHEELKREGHYEISVSDIAKLTFGIPYSSDIEDLANLIKGKSKLRQLIRANNKSTNEALEEDELPEVILQHAEKAIYEISSENTETGFALAGSVGEQNIVRAHQIHEQGISITGLPSGYEDIDQMTLGWQRGDLIVVAARPSVGKTQLAVNFSLNAGLRHNAKIAYFSLEMSNDALVNRMHASESRVNGQRIRNGMLSSQEWDEVNAAQSLLNTAQIHTINSSGITTLGIRSKAMRLIAELGQNLDLIVVDFLQLMASVVNKDYRRGINREQEVSGMTRELKTVAEELNVPLMCIASINRESERRSDHRPQLADLRESGNIEYAADLVMMIYREDYYKKSDPTYVKTNIAEIILAKHRNGPTGTVNLRYEEATGRFDSLYTE